MSRSPLIPALLALLVAAAPATALDLGRPPLAADALLPADQAFQLVGAIRDGDTVRLSWVIAPGYYLYRDRIAVEAVDGAALPALVLPDGMAARDEHFGEVRIFTVAVDGVLPFASAAAVPDRLKLRWQGCAEAGVCYPPVRREVVLTPADR